MIFRRQRHDGAGGFRHPVHLCEAAAEHLDRFAQQVERNGGCAIAQMFHARIIRLPRARIAQDDLDRCGHEEHLADPVIRDEIEHAAGIELARHDIARTGTQTPQPPTRAADMGDRHGDEAHIVLGPDVPVDLCVLQDAMGLDEIGMHQHGALGPSRGARSVKLDRDIVWLQLHLRRCGGLCIAPGLEALPFGTPPSMAITVFTAGAVLRTSLAAPVNSGPTKKNGARESLTM